MARATSKTSQFNLTNFSTARSEQNPEGRWRPFSHDEIVSRDKVSLDLFWLRDESVTVPTCPSERSRRRREIDEQIRNAYAGKADELLAEISDLMGAQEWPPE